MMWGHTSQANQKIEAARVLQKIATSRRTYNEKIDCVESTKCCVLNKIDENDNQALFFKITTNRALKKNVINIKSVDNSTMYSSFHLKINRHNG